MPRLWTETIASHRREVRQAILETTAALVAGHGLRSVTMSQIAREAGIGRATLYKYFPDVEAILLAWHESKIALHLDHLGKLRDAAEDPTQGLRAVLEGYALIAHQAHGAHDADLAAFLHGDERVPEAQRRVRHMIEELIRSAAESSSARDDVPAGELAEYCIHALAAARSLRSKAAIQRLVLVILGGLGTPA